MNDDLFNGALVWILVGGILLFFIVIGEIAASNMHADRTKKTHAHNKYNHEMNIKRLMTKLESKDKLIHKQNELHTRNYNELDQKFKAAIIENNKLRLQLNDANDNVSKQSDKDLLRCEIAVDAMQKLFGDE